ncbi:MAG: response regulator [Solidesulfovibrio sp.]|uniref:response regulator n=1 Tax=Solidesulfovibrio sp. TaxID=2910990 RepID=UPI002B1E9E27|nr:response regulator [Solidesulfovibrio sp.]MEA4858205.1 response regulator [Solidesulfovibrio sp.]
MRVLVVDDDPASRHVLAAHLAGLATCVMCASGPEAVETVRQALADGGSFDVVFLDIIMPHMDGHETLAHIREVEEAAGVVPENRMRAVMVTSMDDETNTMTALFDSQVSAYLVKPANRSELLEKLVALDLLSLE